MVGLVITLEWAKVTLMFETFLTLTVGEIQHALTTIIYLYRNQKAHVACNFNCLVETKDISRSQAVA